MVALNEPVVDRDRLAASLRKWIPVAGSLVRRGEGVFACDIGDTLAAIGLVPAPIAWSDLEGPCATAWYWPQAMANMQGHQAHAIVTLSGEQNNILTRHILLTQVVAATVEATDAVGVYWGSGTLVHSPVSTPE